MLSRDDNDNDDDDDSALLEITSKKYPTMFRP